MAFIHDVINRELQTGLDQPEYQADHSPW